MVHVCRECIKHRLPAWARLHTNHSKVAKHILEKYGQYPGMTAAAALSCCSKSEIESLDQPLVDQLMLVTLGDCTCINELWPGHCSYLGSAAESVLGQA